MLFEMDNSAGGQIETMTKFDGMGVVKTIRYEDFINDIELHNWFAISDFLGLESEEKIHSLNNYSKTKKMAEFYVKRNQKSLFSC